MDVHNISFHRTAASAAALALAIGAGTAATTTAAASAATGSAAVGTSAPTDAASYADALVRAWGAGDRDRAATYATPSVTTALFTYASPGGRLWRRTGTEGAAGTVYVTYRFGSTHRMVTIGVSNVGLASGAKHDAYRVSFG